MSGLLSSRKITASKVKTRTVVTKTFRASTEARIDTIDGLPVNGASLKGLTVQDVILDLQAQDKVSLTQSRGVAWDYFSKKPVLKAMMVSTDGAEVIPLCQQFDFVAGESYNRDDLNKKLQQEMTSEDDKTLWGTFSNNDVRRELGNLAAKMYSNINPVTGDIDVKADNFYSPYIPLVIMSDALPPQKGEDGIEYFNPDGKVSIMEFLDSLNAIKSRSSSVDGRSLSIDNVSNEKDYFNEGYLSCLSSGRSSLFYGLYRRRELMKPITRLELAYITVLCWRDFTRKYDDINGGRFAFGVNADWDKPARYLRKFEDGLKYHLYKKTYNIEMSEDVQTGTVADLRVYKDDCSVTEFIEAMRSGEKGIPLPLMMCLVELDILDLFFFSDSKLLPLREVTRGELAYFLVKLAKTFPMKYISSGDNSYYSYSSSNQVLDKGI